MHLFALNEDRGPGIHLGRQFDAVFGVEAEPIDEAVVDRLDRNGDATKAHEAFRSHDGRGEDEASGNKGHGSARDHRTQCIECHPGREVIRALG
jgi:hypothetical protein